MNHLVRFSARVSRGGLLRFDAFVCALIGSFLSLLSVTSQARKAKLSQSLASTSNSRPDKEQLAACASARLPFLKASERDDPSFERMSRVTRYGFFHIFVYIVVHQDHLNRIYF